jgi:hypothetical protein
MTNTDNEDQSKSKNATRSLAATVSLTVLKNGHTH